MNYRVKNIGIAIGLAALAAILTSVYVVNYKRHVRASRAIEETRPVRLRRGGCE